jgi:hypothetical protein
VRNLRRSSPLQLVQRYKQPRRDCLGSCTLYCTTACVFVVPSVVLTLLQFYARLYNCQTNALEESQ